MAVSGEASAQTTTCHMVAANVHGMQGPRANVTMFTDDGFDKVTLIVVQYDGGAAHPLLCFFVSSFNRWFDAPAEPNPASFVTR